MSPHTNNEDSGAVAKLHPDWLTGISPGDEAYPESLYESESRSTYFAGTSRRVRSGAEVVRVVLAIVAVLGLAWFVTDDVSGRSASQPVSSVSTQM